MQSIMGTLPPVDAQLSICPSLQLELITEEVQLHFAHHDYQNTLQACMSIVPQSSLQGPRINAFIAGRGGCMENTGTLTVLLAKVNDPMILNYIYSAKLVLKYSEMLEVPSLLHRLCNQLYSSTLRQNPSTQYRKKTRQVDGRLIFSAIPGIGKKKAELLHKEYGTLKNFIQDLHKGGTPIIFKLFAPAQLTRIRALFAIN